MIASQDYSQDYSQSCEGESQISFMSHIMSNNLPSQIDSQASGMSNFHALQGLQSNQLSQKSSSNIGFQLEANEGSRSQSQSSINYSAANNQNSQFMDIYQNNTLRDNTTTQQNFLSNTQISFMGEPENVPQIEQNQSTQNLVNSLTNSNDNHNKEINKEQYISKRNTNSKKNESIEHKENIKTNITTNKIEKMKKASKKIDIISKKVKNAENVYCYENFKPLAIPFENMSTISQSMYQELDAMIQKMNLMTQNLKEQFNEFIDNSFKDFKNNVLMIKGLLITETELTIKSENEKKQLEKEIDGALKELQDSIQEYMRNFNV